VHRAVDAPGIYYDVRLPPSKARLNGGKPKRLASSDYAAPVLTPRSPSRIRLICKQIPWPIDIQTNHPGGIKLADIFEELYEQLQKHVSSVEWFIVDDKKRAYVGEIMRRNSAFAKNPRPPTDGVRRVDWLGEHTIVRGLEKDSRFIMERQVGKEKMETWVLVIGLNTI
jgi:hypothetical protein